MSKVVLPLLAICLAGLSISSAQAQVTLPPEPTESASDSERQIVKVTDDFVTLRFYGSPLKAIERLMEELQAPYAMTRIQVENISARAQNIPLSRALDLICETSVPKLEWKKQGALYVFMVAPPAIPAPPQVTVTTALPRPAFLNPLLTINGASKTESTLKSYLISLESQRSSLLSDGWLLKSSTVRRVDTEISAVKHRIEDERRKIARPIKAASSARRTPTSRDN